VRKQSGRNEVYPFIGALCRKNYGNEQFERIVVRQFGFSLWTVFGEIINDKAVAFFNGHGRK
jgi:hypothetical protein